MDSSSDILEHVPIYKYSRDTYEFICKYNTFDDLRKAEPTLNHQMIKDNMMRDRMVTGPYRGYTYSAILDIVDKYNFIKPMTDQEKNVIDQLKNHHDAQYVKVAARK